jgi:hypothetical protein
MGDLGYTAIIQLAESLTGRRGSASLDDARAAEGALKQLSQ